MRELAHGGGIAESNIDVLETPVALDKDLLGSVHEHIGDVVVVQESLNRTEPEELGAECLELIVGQFSRDGGTDALP
jgi:hypothetical protein